MPEAHLDHLAGTLEAMQVAGQAELEFCMNALQGLIGSERTMFELREIESVQDQLLDRHRALEVGDE